MKKMFLLPLALVITLTSCDAPSQRRSLYSGSSSTSSNNYSDNTNNTGNSNTDSGSDRTDTTTPVSQIPAEINHCTWSTDGVTGFANNSDAHLGAHTICQSSVSGRDGDVYIQLRNAITDAQICLIPTYESGGQSFYIGNPRCFIANEGGKTYKVVLLKDRDNGRYMNLKINSVMVMKDAAHYYEAPFNPSQRVLAPDAYMFCSKFLELYNDASYCTSFKAKGAYVYKRF